MSEYLYYSDKLNKFLIVERRPDSPFTFLYMSTGLLSRSSHEVNNFLSALGYVFIGEL